MKQLLKKLCVLLSVDVSRDYTSFGSERTEDLRRSIDAGRVGWVGGAKRGDCFITPHLEHLSRKFGGRGSRSFFMWFSVLFHRPTGPTCSPQPQPLPSLNLP